MVTYQDLLNIPQNDRDRAEFVRFVITAHEASDLVITAKIAEEYERGRNITTMQYQKMITDITGRRYPDPTATVHRSCSNFFRIFTTQVNQYLLGNGVQWKTHDGKRLGEDFDSKLQKAGLAALVGGIAYGFWNVDHVEIFKATEFAPLMDEETGAIASGVHYWQIDEQKPLRGTLYELDGFTEYLYSNNPDLKISNSWMRIADGIFVHPKRAYISKVRMSLADGREIVGNRNYPGFPVVPLWGNSLHQSELSGLREKIDAYDFILNGWEDDLDSAQLYWIIKGAGGMDDYDLRMFLDRLRNVQAAAPEDGQDIQPVTVQIPVEARAGLLAALKRQLYEDAMAFNPDDVKSGSTVTAQIDAAYEPLDLKTTDFEYCVLDFISGLMEIAGIKDEPTFTRSKISNSTELISTVIQAANHLSSEYVTRKILTLLGDGDQADEILKAIDAESAERLAGIGIGDNGGTK